MRFVLIIFLCLIGCLSGHAQQLDDVISRYLSTDIATEQYDLFSELMFGNSEYSFKDLKKEAAINMAKAEAEHDPRYTSIAYSIIGDAYYLAGKRDSAMTYYLLQAASLEGIDHTTSHLTLIASGLGNAANSANTLGQRTKSIDLAHEALPYAVKIGDPRGEADLFYLLANGYQSVLQPDSALFYFNKCYRINLASGDQRSMASNLMYIGSIYMTQSKNRLALETYHDALNVLPDSSAFRSPRMQAYSNISNAYSSLGLIDSAFHFLTLAKQESSQLKSKNYSNRIELRLIDILLKDDIVQAEQRLDKLRSITDEEESLSVLLGIETSCSRMYLKKNEIEKAAQCLDRAFDIVENSDLKYQKEVLYPLAIEIYEEQGNHAKALKYSKLNSEQIRAYNNDEIEKAILSNEFKHEREGLEKDNELRNLENTLLSTKLSRRRWISLVLSALLALALISAYLIWRQSKNKVKMQNLAQEAVLVEKERLYLEKEMEALRAQMNPHFLFNSLNSINHYILNEEPRQASSYLSKFSQLMRMILSNSKQRYVALAKELNAIRLYTEIENLRFEDKFNYVEKLGLNLDLDEILVPPLILQPFVENCIKHAFVGVEEDCEIVMEIEKSKDQLLIQISDNGVGLKNSKVNNRSKNELNKSYGLEITKSRLELIAKLYKIECHMEVRSILDDDGHVMGTMVYMEVPIIQEDV